MNQRTDPGTTTRADRAAITRLCELWSPLWNGEPALAHRLVTDDFQIWFGAADGDPQRDLLRGPQEFADLVSRHLATRPGLTFAMRGEPVIDVEQQRAAIGWTATLPDRATGVDRVLGGIDAFSLRDGRFARCWSVTGARPLEP
jgi:hypothetical protein